MARSKRSSGRNSKRRRSMRRRRQSGGLLQMLGGGEKRNVHWQNFFDVFPSGLFFFNNMDIIVGWKMILLKLVVFASFIALLYYSKQNTQLKAVKFMLGWSILILQHILSIFERHETGKTRPGHFFGIEIFQIWVFLCCHAFFTTKKVLKLKIIFIISYNRLF